MRRLGFSLVVAIALFGCDSGSEPPDPNQNNGCEHVDFARGVELVADSTQLYRQLNTTVSGGIVVGATGRVDGIEVFFLDAAGERIFIANDCEINRLELEFDSAGIVESERPSPTLRWVFDIVAQGPGTTAMRVELWHDNHAHFRSEPVPVTVTP